MKLSAYLSEHGSKSNLARTLGTQPQLVWQWATGTKPVPIWRCTSIEAATGGAVTRQDLRPDDWQKIWPELALAQTESAQAATENVAEQGAQRAHH